MSIHDFWSIFKLCFLLIIMIFLHIPNQIMHVYWVIHLTMNRMYWNSKENACTKMEGITQTKPDEVVHGASIAKVQEQCVVPTKVSSPWFLFIQRVSPRIDPTTKDNVWGYLDSLLDTFSNGASSSPWQTGGIPISRIFNAYVSKGFSTIHG